MITPDKVLPCKVKAPWEDRLYNIVLSDDDFAAAEFIASVTSVTAASCGLVHGSSDITISGATHDANRTVQARISGGTELEEYIITARVETTGSNKIQVQVKLLVSE